jgi:AraC-like DNA-binding protein
MTSTIRTDEAHDFTHAVAGAEIEFIRKDRGHGPAVMTRADGGSILLSAGGMGFSTVIESHLPDGAVALQVVTVDPGGVTMYGLPVEPGRPTFFAPGSPIFGHLTAGVRATTIVTSEEAVQSVAADLRLGHVDLRRPRMRMDPVPGVRSLVDRLGDLTHDPGLLEVASNGTRLVEHLAVALAADAGPTNPGRRRDSGSIVALAIDYVEQTGTWQPTMSELCRASLASVSSLRAAFVEVMGIPPTAYFQLRVLRELRGRLLAGVHGQDTVTEHASALGLTQFGRVAGRYRALYGETPSQTLRGNPGRPSGGLHVPSSNAMARWR